MSQIAIILYNNGNPRFSPAVGAMTLHKNDAVSVTLSGFPRGSRISTVKFFGNRNNSGADAKDESARLGNWTRDRGNEPALTAHYTCRAVSDTEIEIKDTEDLASGAEHKHWYSVEGSLGGGGTWSVDPELINKGNP